MSKELTENGMFVQECFWDILEIYGKALLACRRKYADIPDEQVLSMVKKVFGLRQILEGWNNGNKP